MTRFWITLDQGVHFVMDCIEQMQGGEVFVPKIPSMKITDLANAVAPNTKVDVIGIRPGEKLHEVLISEDEARNTIELEKMYVVQPAEALWFGHTWESQGRSLPNGYRYASNNNTQWLSIEDLKKIIEPIENGQVYA
jgi:UDP-N-acetylglucosamine 4,6-dehydratase